MQRFLAKSKGWPGFILSVSPVTAGVAHTMNRDGLTFPLDLCRRCPSGLSLTSTWA
jgi:hypothetical protein